MLIERNGARTEMKTLALKHSCAFQIFGQLAFPDGAVHISVVEGNI